MKKENLFVIALGLLLINMIVSTYNIAPAVLNLGNAWWNYGWQYRRKIGITEKSGYDLSDFPVEVSFEHSGHAQLDGNDIRVVDNETEIPSCVTAVNGTHVTVLFEIDIQASSTKFLYIYYGNPSVIAPNYPKIPLIISEGNTGHAIIDNSVYIGWDYTSWGWSNNVELWNDFRIDFDGNGDPTDNNDLITDYGTRQGGIGRHRRDVEAIGLGLYQDYVQTPVYADICFADAVLRIYRNHSWVETTEADFLFMFSPSWDYANFGTGSEQNIVDGENTNKPGRWNDVYFSKMNPGWMGFRDSASPNVFASTGLRIGEDYNYFLRAKEAADWDRAINYFTGPERDFPLAPYDQPSNCRIYWYGDFTNGYSNIEITANILCYPPSITIGKEEAFGILLKELSIKLTGEHDYSSKENVKIRLSALVRDVETMEPVSSANVTIEIYDPEGDLWISDNMTERLLGTGIYEWESNETIVDLNIEDGVYLAYAKASYQEGPTATDILEFHIDPPFEEPTQLHTILLLTMVGVLVTVISIWYIDHRRLARKHQPERTA